MGIDFPIVAEALTTVAGVTTLAVVLAMIVKHYLENKRWIPAIVIGITEVFSVGVRFVIAHGRPTPEEVLGGILTGLFGAALAVFGYEMVANLLGIAGIGSKSDAAKISKAVTYLVERGFNVKNLGD